jgi:hypothetical protein
MQTPPSTGAFKGVNWLLANSLHFQYQAPAGHGPGIHSGNWRHDVDIAPPRQGPRLSLLR